MHFFRRLELPHDRSAACFEFEESLNLSRQQYARFRKVVPQKERVKKKKKIKKEKESESRVRKNDFGARLEFILLLRVGSREKKIYNRFIFNNMNHEVKFDKLSGMYSI